MPQAVSHVDKWTQAHQAPTAKRINQRAGKTTDASNLVTTSKNPVRCLDAGVCYPEAGLENHWPHQEEIAVLLVTRMASLPGDVVVERELLTHKLFRRTC